MSPTRASATELRVLVAAPVGRDAELTAEVLRELGVECVPCASVEELVRELGRGAGAVLVTSEALAAGGVRALANALEKQEPWSEVPVVLAAATGDVRARELLGLVPGSVAVLERPIRLVTLQTVVRSALRARKRQYQARDLLAELEVHVARLDAEGVVRERFVSLLAHDLRGPLSAATLAARMLSGQPELLDRRRELALRIERGLARIDRMIQDLLDANRLRAGHRLPIRPQPCDLAEVVADVVADLPDRDRARVRSSTPDRLEGVWDPDQLRRALWNLVTNALKYGDAEGTVRVVARHEGEDVTVSVHNPGRPIPEREQARIFEPFRRADGAEGQARGWGLGLTLVRGCAEAHGGALELRSTEADGTVFALRLPPDARPFAELEAAAPG